MAHATKACIVEYYSTINGYSGQCMSLYVMLTTHSCKH